MQVPSFSMSQIRHSALKVDFLPLIDSGDQSVNDMIDILIKFFAAQTRRLLLFLELQKTQVDGVGKPRLVSGFISLHAHFLKS